MSSTREAESIAHALIYGGSDFDQNNDGSVSHSSSSRGRRSNSRPSFRPNTPSRSLDMSLEGVEDDQPADQPVRRRPQYPTLKSPSLLKNRDDAKVYSQDTCDSHNLDNLVSSFHANPLRRSQVSAAVSNVLPARGVASERMIAAEPEPDSPVPPSEDSDSDVDEEEDHENCLHRVCDTLWSRIVTTKAEPVGKNSVFVDFGCLLCC